MNEGTGAAPELDVALLRGFEFQCRPDCGLCCYAEPRVTASEQTRLLQIVPELEWSGSGDDRFLASRPNGGACSLLVEQRCRAHDVRPRPCREFPITVHVGERLQATVVLSCPGVDLAGLSRGGRDVGRAPLSLETELRSVEGRIDAGVARQLTDAMRRRRKIVRALKSDGRWEEDADVRRRLEEEIPLPTAADFPVADPPSVDDGLDYLPLFYDRRASPVALAAGLGGWELLELSPTGGSRKTWGVVPPPERPPAVDPAGVVLLRHYLEYWLQRDALFGAVQLAMVETADRSPVTDWVRQELRMIGAIVLARADVRARSVHEGGLPLTPAEIADGIRATDQDLLDRPTWGDRL